MNTKRNHGFTVSILTVMATLLLSVFTALPAAAGEPTDQVRQTVDEVLKILNDKNLKQPGKEEERRKMIRAVVLQRFDFGEMAKRALGIHWKKRTSEEQKEFVGLFTDLLQNTYIRRVERYENEKVDYVAEKTEGEYAVVRTKIHSPNQPEVPVDYKIFKKDNKWSVYDIVIEGVSLVNNYRTQFTQIIGSSSYEELVKRLKAKTLKDS